VTVIVYSAVGGAIIASDVSSGIMIGLLLCIAINLLRQFYAQGLNRKDTLTALQLTEDDCFLLRGDSSWRKGEYRDALTLRSHYCSPFLQILQFQDPMGSKHYVCVFPDSCDAEARRHLRAWLRACPR
jgi:hypothetical protein